MNATEQVLIEKIKQLPPQRLAEVEDFVDFLRMREDDQRLIHAANHASEATFAAVWNNDEDAAYDVFLKSRRWRYGGQAGAGRPGVEECETLTEPRACR